MRSSRPTLHGLNGCLVCSEGISTTFHGYQYLRYHTPSAPRGCICLCTTCISSNEFDESLLSGAHIARMCIVSPLLCICAPPIVYPYISSADCTPHRHIPNSSMPINPMCFSKSYVPFAVDSVNSRQYNPVMFLVSRIQALINHTLSLS
jgi:hypothetical protein